MGLITECRDALDRIKSRTHLLERMITESQEEEITLDAASMLAIENYQDLDLIEKQLDTLTVPPLDEDLPPLDEEEAD